MQHDLKLHMDKFSFSFLCIRNAIKLDRCRLHSIQTKPYQEHYIITAQVIQSMNIITMNHYDTVFYKMLKRAAF